MTPRSQMRIGLLASVLLLATGCGSSDGPAEEDALAEAAEGNAALSPEEVARLRSQAVAALNAVMPNADRATFRNLRTGFLGAICGEVETGGSGARPFIVTADGRAILSPTPGLDLEDPTAGFPSVYARYCATAEDLRRIDAQLNAMLPAGGERNSTPIDDLSVPIDDAPAEPSEPAGKAEEPRRQTDDSFFNSVLRSPRRDEPSR